MTPEVLAALHARAMNVQAPWTPTEFADLMAHPATFIVRPPAVAGPQMSLQARRTAPLARAGAENEAVSAFALGRVILDEAELLTLAVDPPLRRTGLGRSCLIDFESAARAGGATRAFLEVAEDNAPARALYRAGGWTETGLRRAYYRTENGRVDAVLMRKTLLSD